MNTDESRVYQRGERVRNGSSEIEHIVVWPGTDPNTLCGQIITSWWARPGDGHRLCKRCAKKQEAPQEGDHEQTVETPRTPGAAGEHARQVRRAAKHQRHGDACARCGQDWPCETAPDAHGINDRCHTHETLFPAGTDCPHAGLSEREHLTQVAATQRAAAVRAEARIAKALQLAGMLTVTPESRAVLDELRATLDTTTLEGDGHS